MSEHNAIAIPARVADFTQPGYWDIPATALFNLPPWRWAHINEEFTALLNELAAMYPDMEFWVTRGDFMLGGCRIEWRYRDPERRRLSE